jgi:hypothetical protein
MPTRATGRSRVSVAPDAGLGGIEDPGPPARPGSACRTTGPAYPGNKLTLIRLTEGCGNRALSDGVQSPQAVRPRRGVRPMLKCLGMPSA